MVPSEINEMEELRGQLNQLLLLSERNIPGGLLRAFVNRLCIYGSCYLAEKA
jgi:hypothetical protein